MKRSRHRLDNVVEMRHVDAAAMGSAPTAGVSEDQIAQRAYELYCARGCESGHDRDAWFQAERGLRGDATTSAA